MTQPALAKAPPRQIRNRVTFQTGDALQLPALGRFDLVLAANLLDRVKDPKKLLQKVLPPLVLPGGLLLLTSPYSWSQEFTPGPAGSGTLFPPSANIFRPIFAWSDAKTSLFFCANTAANSNLPSLTPPFGRGAGNPICLLVSIATCHHT